MFEVGIREDDDIIEAPDPRLVLKLHRRRLENTLNLQFYYLGLMSGM